MKRSISPNGSTSEKKKKVYWLTPLLGLLLIAALAVMACGPAAVPGPQGTPTPQASPTPEPTPAPQLVEEAAPIESLAIEVAATKPMQADLVVVSALPNACYSLGNSDLSRDGDTITLAIMNVKPAGEVACAEIFRTVTTRIPLEGNVEPCQTYTVIANGASHSVQAIAPNVRCGNPTGGVGAGMTEVLAPIESVAIEVTGAGPGQAELIVVSGLPNGCVSFKDYTVSRDGDTISVEVINIKPSNPNLVCTMIYGTVTTRIPLDSGVEPCQTYTVVANGKSYSARAVTPDGSCDSVSGALDTEVNLGVGETVQVGTGGLSVTFVEVTEDSRCPSDAICVRAGQANILLRAEMNGQALGEFSLGVGEGQENKVVTLAEGYTAKLLRLDPYPVSTRMTQPDEYVAYLVIFMA